MPPKKKPYSQLCDSAKFFRDNPSSRKKKDATSKKINSRPAQKAKRAELAKARRDRGIMGKGGGDLSHEGGKLVRRSVKANRGNSKNTAGDRRARGKGTTKKRTKR